MQSRSDATRKAAEAQRSQASAQVCGSRQSGLVHQLCWPMRQVCAHSGRGGARIRVNRDGRNDHGLGACRPSSATGARRTHVAWPMKSSPVAGINRANAITAIACLCKASGKSIPLTQIARPVLGWEPGVSGM